MKPTVLPAGNPGPMTGEGNLTYLIEGDVPVLIDAGIGTAAHLDAIDAAVRDRPLHLVVTHAHSDHIAGAPAIRDRHPSARLSKIPWPLRDRDLPWTPLANGDVLSTGHGDLEVVHTPGHAPDHICLWHEPTRTIFVGDMLVKGSTVVIPASHGGSVRQYLQSLATLLELEPRRALPAHGAVIDEPQELMHSYVKHRMQREAQVREAIHHGADTIEAMLARIYPDVSDALVAMARESVLAHLVKLQEDNEVVERGGRWHAVR